MQKTPKRLLDTIQEDPSELDPAQKCCRPGQIQEVHHAGSTD